MFAGEFPQSINVSSMKSIVVFSNSLSGILPFNLCRRHQSLECCSFTEIRSHEQFQRVSETVLSSLFSTFWKSIDGYYQTFMPLIQKLTIYQYCSLHSFSNNESLLKPNVLIFYSISKASTWHTTWGRNRYCIEFSFNY